MSAAMFSTLESSTATRSRRGMAFICGLLAQALMLSAAVIVGELFPQELSLTRHFVVTWIPELTPTRKLAVKPPRVLPRVTVQKVRLPDPPALPQPTIAALEIPKIQHTISRPLRSPEVLPPPALTAQTPMPKVQIAVHTGLFGGAAEPVTTRRPVDQVQTGGFGTPEALPGRAQGNSTGNVAKLGSFGLPDGPGAGNGSGGFHGVQGVVASAGFGSGIAGVGTGNGTGRHNVAMAGFGAGITNGPRGRGEASKVTTGGFEKVSLVAQTTKSQPATTPVQFQPVEIVSKPSPVYTDEARRLAIQGEVALSVVFQANGSLRIIGIVSSLGHGLDQAAEQAAAQIRFKAAQRDGKPTDFPATLRIQFRLADQSI